MILLNYIFCDISSLLGDQLVGVILGLIIAWLISLFSIVRRRAQDKKLYDRYNGKYQVLLKDSPDSEPQYELEIEVKGNIFMISGQSCLNKDKVTGMITMDRSMKFYGRGYYKHELYDPKFRKFGFYEIQLDDGRILSHQIIKGVEPTPSGKLTGSDKSAGYIWYKK